MRAGATPYNDKVVESVKGCEQGIYMPCMENLKLFQELKQ